jgi:hypothetical protein
MTVHRPRGASMECLDVHPTEGLPPAPTEAPAAPAAERPDADLAAEVATLRDAIATRTIIGQATGLLAGQLNLTTPTAWRVMRRLSNETNIKLRDIARALVDAHDGRRPPDSEVARAIGTALGPALAAVQEEDGDHADEAGLPVREGPR